MRFSKLFFLSLISISCLAQKKREIEFKIENDSTIIQYLTKNKIAFSNNQIATLKGIRTFSEFGKAEKLAIPDAYFFNSVRGNLPYVMNQMFV